MPINLAEERVAHSCLANKHESDDACVQVPDNGACLISNPRLHTVRIYFTQTATEEDSTMEARFIVEQFMKPLYQKYPTYQWFVFADFTASDDASAVSAEALRFYADAVKDKQTAQVVCYNLQPGMHAIVTMLSHVPLIKNKVHLAVNEAEALKLYDDWSHNDVSLRILSDQE